MSLHRTFVYGTLKRGQPNYYLLQDVQNGVAKFLGEAKLVKKYPLVVASQFKVPVLLDKEGDGKDILGELYEVDDKMLQHLDWLENHPLVYKRIPIQCVMLKGNSINPLPIDCEVYMIFDFQPYLLTLPFLSSYEDSPDSKYKCKNEREDGVPSFIDEIKLKH